MSLQLKTLASGGGGGGAGGSSSHISWFYAPLVNYAFVEAYGNNLASGTTDVYTVPTGKKALIIGISLHNQTGSTITYSFSAKISETYYRLSSNQSIASGTGQSSYNDICSTCLNAGESLAITTDVAGLNLFVKILEFNSSAPIYTTRLLTLDAGNNTLYTCPSGKMAWLLASGGGMSFLNYGTFYWYNSTASAVNYTWYVVPNGQSPSTSNRIYGQASLSANSRSVINAYINLNAGDSIVLNVGTANAGHAWVSYIEL